LAQHTTSLGDNESQNREDIDNGDGNNEENSVSNGDVHFRKDETQRKRPDMKHYRENQMGDITKKSKRGLGIEQGHGVKRREGKWVDE